MLHHCSTRTTHFLLRTQITHSLTYLLTHLLDLACSHLDSSRPGVRRALPLIPLKIHHFAIFLLLFHTHTDSLSHFIHSFIHNHSLALAYSHSLTPQRPATALLDHTNCAIFLLLIHTLIHTHSRCTLLRKIRLFTLISAQRSFLLLIHTHTQQQYQQLKHAPLDDPYSNTHTHTHTHTAFFCCRFTKRTNTNRCCFEACATGAASRTHGHSRQSQF